MAKSKFDTFEVIKNGSNLVYGGVSKRAGKPAEITEEEKFAFWLIDQAAEILKSHKDQFPHRRLASINIWEDHISATVTQYFNEIGQDHKILGYVFTKPSEGGYQVFRSE